MLGPPPRKIRLTANGLGLRFLVWVLVPAIPLLFYFMGNQSVEILQRLQLSGRVVSVRVTGKWTTPDRYGANYYLSYGGNTPYGLVHGETRLTPSDYQLYEPGDRVSVTVHPTDTRKKVFGVVDNARLERVTAAGKGMTIFAWCIVVALLVPAEVSIWREKRYLRDGIAMPARITSVYRSAPKSAFYTVVEYEYQRPDGRIGHGRDVANIPRTLRKGSEATALYLPTSQKGRLLDTLTSVKAV